MYKFEMIKNYKEDESLRKSFDVLAQETFGLSFETWYQNGYWSQKYNPHSIVIDHTIVANVSVNQMEFVKNGETHRYIQLGTVMTDKKYQNRGFIKAIMQEIDREYAKKVDGIYLFANKSVLEFYPKFGFHKSSEYQYFTERTKQVNNEKKEKKETMIQGIKPIQMNRKENWKLLESAIEKATNNNAFEMRQNKELIMFYVTQFMQDDVYYLEDENAYVIAEIGKNHIVLHNIFSDRVVDLNYIIEAFGSKQKKVILGFTPLQKEGFEIKKVIYNEDTLFTKGKGFDLFEQEKLYFSKLTHA